VCHILLNLYVLWNLNPPQLSRGCVTLTPRGPLVSDVWERNGNCVSDCAPCAAIGCISRKLSHLLCTYSFSLKEVRWNCTKRFCDPCCLFLPRRLSSEPEPAVQHTLSFWLRARSSLTGHGVRVSPSDPLKPTRNLVTRWKAPLCVTTTGLFAVILVTRPRLRPPGFYSLEDKIILFVQ
jgi:hypothetical protein